MIGALVRYRDDRGYGFISHNDGSREQTFVHIAQLRLGGIESPKVGDVYEFDIKTVKDGKMAAANLRLAN